MVDFIISKPSGDHKDSVVKTLETIGSVVFAVSGSKRRGAVLLYSNKISLIYYSELLTKIMYSIAIS